MSSNTGVATINSTGLATGVGAGSTNITATQGSITSPSISLSVTPSLVSIAVTPKNQSIAQGVTQQFAATGTFSDGSTQDLTGEVSWASDTSAVATIASNGVATGVAPGNATISATLGSIQGSTVLTVSTPMVTVHTPMITWSNPADITAGTALGDAQLDATASVPGSFTYSPPAGTVLGVGSGQVLTVEFTPADTAHYRTASAAVVINVPEPPPPPAPSVTQIAIGAQSRKGLSMITVSFSEPMNAASAGNRGLYSVLGAVIKHRRPSYTRFVPIGAVAYNPANNTASITLAKPYKGPVQVTVQTGVQAANGTATASPRVIPLP
jgi:hypothetical protein